MKYKFILFSPWLLQSPVRVRGLGFRVSPLTRRAFCRIQTSSFTPLGWPEQLLRLMGKILHDP